MINKIPDFLIIGGQRCGTGWLSQCLREHPQICMAEDETRFFDNKFEKGINWYLTNFFQKCEVSQVVGEKTANYLFDPKAPKRIYESLPKAKLIVVLRNPIERLISSFLLKNPDLKSLKSDKFYQIVKEHPDILERGLYSKQLDSYYEHYEKDKILIKIYEDKDKDAITFIQDVYSFLNVTQDFIPTSLNLQTKLGRSQYTSKYKKMLGRVLMSKYSPIKELYRRMITGESKPSLDHDKRAWVQNFYHDEIKRIESLTGRDLSFWS